MNLLKSHRISPDFKKANDPLITFVVFFLWFMIAVISFNLSCACKSLSFCMSEVSISNPGIPIYVLGMFNEKIAEISMLCFLSNFRT